MLYPELTRAAVPALRRRHEGPRRARRARAAVDDVIARCGLDAMARPAHRASCRRATASASAWRRRCSAIRSVLVLDEPTVGPRSGADGRDARAAARRSTGCTVLLSTHILAEARRALHAGRHPAGRAPGGRRHAGRARAARVEGAERVVVRVEGPAGEVQRGAGGASRRAGGGRARPRPAGAVAFRDRAARHAEPVQRAVAGAGRRARAGRCSRCATEVPTLEDLFVRAGATEAQRARLPRPAPRRSSGRYFGVAARLPGRRGVPRLHRLLLPLRPGLLPHLRLRHEHHGELLAARLHGRAARADLLDPAAHHAAARRGATARDARAAGHVSAVATARSSPPSSAPAWSWSRCCSARTVALSRAGSTRVQPFALDAARRRLPRASLLLARDVRVVRALRLRADRQPGAGRAS